MRGGSADRLLAESGAWPLDQVTRLIVEVGGALVAAHASGVVHGDVKQANVLLDETDHHYVADFGIASEVEHDGSRTATVDQFGLAATAWELLTGISPFAGVRGSGSVWASSERGSAAGQALLPPSECNPATGHATQARTRTTSQQAQRPACSLIGRPRAGLLQATHSITHTTPRTSRLRLTEMLLERRILPPNGS